MKDLFDLAAFEPAPAVPEMITPLPAAPPKTPPEFSLQPDVVVEPDLPPKPAEFEPAVESTGQMFFDGLYTKEDIEAMKTDEFFPKVDDKIQTDFRCPACSYEWSGNPKPKPEEAETT